MAEAAQGKGNNLLLLRMSSRILQHILPKQTLVCLVVESTLSGDREGHQVLREDLRLDPRRQSKFCWSLSLTGLSMIMTFQAQK